MKRLKLNYNRDVAAAAEDLKRAQELARSAMFSDTQSDAARFAYAAGLLDGAVEKVLECFDEEDRDDAAKGAL